MSLLEEVYRQVIMAAVAERAAANGDRDTVVEPQSDEHGHGRRHCKGRGRIISISSASAQTPLDGVCVMARA